jgi:hypothetical protein
MQTANENSNTAIVEADSAYSIMPRDALARIEQAKQMLALNTQLQRELLAVKVDYDRIPGTDKPTLLKPGAEMLCKVYGLTIGDQRVTDKTEDWERGIFSYAVTCPLIHIESGRTVAVGIGAANSQEVKYKYVTAKDENGKKIYSNNKPVKVENPDAADNINTLIKMASKRAFVDAVLKATCASRLFTQDVEDMKAFSAARSESEPASSSQVGFIRKLANGDIKRVQAVLGTNVASFEAILRSDASRLIDALKAQQQRDAPQGGGYAEYPPLQDDGMHGDAYYPDDGAPASPAPARAGAGHSCADCGAPVTDAENGYSSKKFGRPLCRKCQSAAAR